ncbi:hypothetical protein ACU4GD_24415 [Cupriavidus basilensis]
MSERFGANERRMALELDAARAGVREGQHMLEKERKAGQQKLAEAAESARRQAEDAARLTNAVAVLDERVRQQDGLLAEYRQLLESRAEADADAVRAGGTPARQGLARARPLQAGTAATF